MVLSVLPRLNTIEGYSPSFVLLLLALSFQKQSYSIVKMVAVCIKNHVDWVPAPIRLGIRIEGCGCTGVDENRVNPGIRDRGVLQSGCVIAAPWSVMEAKGDRREVPVVHINAYVQEREIAPVELGYVRSRH